MNKVVINWTSKSLLNISLVPVEQGATHYSINPNNTSHSLYQTIIEILVVCREFIALKNEYCVVEKFMLNVCF